MSVFYRLYYNKRLRYAIPFLIFVVGGSVGLREFTSLRYKYRVVEPHNIKDEAKKHGISLRNPEEITLESQYEQLKKEDIDHWENVRVPRPKYIES